MRKIHVPLQENSYDVIIEPGLINHIDDYIDKSREIVIISDDNIPKTYINTIKSFLSNCLCLYVPHGEKSKSMEMANSLVNSLIHNNITRGCLIVALGGGVVGDLAGFVASIYMRGVDYIQIPTTLLSQIDSSVGGKVGVNTETMKNAIGSFKQPKLVLIDSTTLQTLDERQINNGIAEMIKYGLIASKTLFEDLYSLNIFDDIDKYIYQCVQIKKDIVVQDVFDNGIRQILNYGHTIGHAIEQYSKYELLHGEAISIGMMSMSIGTIFEKEIKKVLTKYNLPTSHDYDKEALYRYITTDKKANKNNLNIIMVDKVGKGYIKPIIISQIKERL